MSAASEDEDEVLQAKVDLFKQAVRRLAAEPNEVVGACLMAFETGALGIIADASDDVLEKAAGFFGDRNVYQALRLLASLALTMKQARRYADFSAPIFSCGSKMRKRRNEPPSFYETWR
jgi:hypothetical protein